MTHPRCISGLLVVCLASSIAPTVGAQRRATAHRRVLVSRAVAPDRETSTLVTDTILDTLDPSHVVVVRGQTALVPTALPRLWTAMRSARVAMGLAASVEDAGSGNVRLRLVLGRRAGGRMLFGDAVVPRESLSGAVRSMLPRLVGARERAVMLRETDGSRPRRSYVGIVVALAALATSLALVVALVAGGFGEDWGRPPEVPWM